MHEISTKDLLTELRRRIDSSKGIDRQDLVYDVFAITRDHLTDLSTGNVSDLGSLCEEETDRRLDAEDEYHAGPAAN